MVACYRGAAVANQNLVNIHHLRAALPYIDEMLTEEEESLQQLEYDKEDPVVVMDDDSRSDEYICSNCKVCLWNLVVVLRISPKQQRKRHRGNSRGGDKSTEVVIIALPRHLCGPCAVELQNSEDQQSERILSVMFRFQPTAELRAQFNQIQV
jgi:hypothetical protein